MSSPFAPIRTALGLAALLGGLGLSGGAWAQESKLQACPTSEFVRWDNCFGTHTHEGNKYIGEWVSNMYDGLGTLIYRGGAIYSGEFKENERHGQGKMAFPDGQLYIGGWKRGNPEG